MTWHKNCLNCDTNDTKIVCTMAFAKTAVHFKVDRFNTALETRLIRELVDSMWGLKQLKVSVDFDKGVPKIRGAEFLEETQ